MLLVSTAGLVACSEKPESKPIYEVNGSQVQVNWPQEMQAARYSKTPFVIGDLGGVPVRIPDYFAENVAYNGDTPNWSGAHKNPNPTPKRTFASKLKIFGFDVRYPDMVGKSTDALATEQYNAQPQSTTPWIHVTVKTGEIFTGEGATTRLAEGKIDPYPYPSRSYTRMPNEVIGGKVMEAYVVLGKDPKTQVPYRHDADDIFIFRDKNTHQVKTYIRCTSRKVPSPPCRHYFELSPKMYADIEISYDRWELPEWHKIEQKVRDLILSFEDKSVSHHKED